ncbi:MAG: hypothetical protein L6433_12915, partial [Actinomycetia bacterium]|nr:hypothetical protein [Actinomycetota bacterium]MCG2819879.1 hypothetical protein [Actinomycetes bacterium]
DGLDNTKLCTEQHQITPDGRDNTIHLELENRPAFTGLRGFESLSLRHVSFSGAFYWHLLAGTLR